MESKRMIFQLGTNNWQVPGEFAPGSGILHEAHHKTYEGMGVKCCSIFPSKNQTCDRSDVKVFKLEHDIPICESISPVSSFRWHSMSEEDFTKYRERLEKEVYEFMAEQEASLGGNFTLAIAHHTFLNPIVMRNVLKKRHEEGKPHCNLAVFVHGTALKMFVHERNGKAPEEFPNRFLPWVKSQDYWKDVDVGFAISEQQVKAFHEIFPEYPEDRVVVSPNGVNQQIFHPIEGTTVKNLLPQFTSIDEGDAPLPADYDKLVVFVGKFANWKRLDSVLAAAKIYEAEFEKKGVKIATAIIGTGPPEDKAKYFKMKKDLGLKHTYFLGPQQQPILAKFYTAADVGVFPSYKEPFGMVFIENMACGTPCIGANSGGPPDFVTPEVGELVPESGTSPNDLGIEQMTESVAAAVIKAINEDWKSTKGVAGLKLAVEKYSTLKQCKELLESADRIIAANKK